MRAACQERRLRRLSGRVRDTLDTLGGTPPGQGFDLSILFQEYQEYQLTHRGRVILSVDTLGDLTSSRWQKTHDWPLLRCKSGRRSRNKGTRTERAVVPAQGIAATKISGEPSPKTTMSLLGTDREVKCRAAGFAQLYNWLSARHPDRRG
jgi:hypothetical protein